MAVLKRLFAKRSVTLGLDIRQEELRFACLENTNQGANLIHQGHIESQPTDEGFLHAAEALRQTLERRKIRPGRIIVGLPRQWFFIKALTLPIMAEEDVESALTFELEKHLPVEPETLIHDHNVLTDRIGRDMTVLVGAISRELIESFLSAWRAKELRPDAIMPAPFANMMLLELCRPEISQMQKVLMVEQDNQAVGVDLFEQGYLTSSQLFSLDDLSGAEAAAYLEKELFRGLSSVLEHFRSTQDPNWFFLGPSDGVAVQAMQALGLSLPKPIDHGTVIQAPEEVDVVRYHTAVGLALYGHQDEPFPMNLIPPPAAAVSEPKRLPGRAVLLGTAIIMLLGLYGANTIRHQWELRRLKENVDALRPQIEEVHRMNRELNQLKAQAGAVEAMTARDPSALQMLRELTLVIPSSAWLTEAGFTGSEMIIGGYAQSSQELIGLLEESPLFANIEFRGTITKREGKERFKIAAQIE